MRKLNLAIIGVLYPTKNETQINDTIKKLNGSLYWLSWGFRYQTLTKVCNYLYKNGFWTCTSRRTFDGYEYFLYSSISKCRFPLIFFHHDSKSQGGRGLIYYKYEIDKVIITKYGSLPIIQDNLSYKPLKPISKVWFGITRVCPLEREGIDFKTFLIHSEITGKSERNVEASDSSYLYYQVLPVKEPYHNDKDETCNCLICR